MHIPEKAPLTKIGSLSDKRVGEIHARAGNCEIRGSRSSRCVTSQFRACACIIAFFLLLLDEGRDCSSSTLTTPQQYESEDSVHFSFLSWVCSAEFLTVRQRKFAGKTLGAALSPHFCEYPCVLVWQLLATMEQIFCCYHVFRCGENKHCPVNCKSS